ncbi:MAG: quinolinate synthase NadA [Candidatus Electrothrix scaldis]|nr:MAG: quinolinate synthase NadA [Candidatus Electrothrix sp. GW3-3]
MSFAHQPDIGSLYQGMQEEELVERIAARKKELADNLLILSHHYQHDSIYQFADLTGDSLKLAADAAKIKDKQFLIFCGVHFMAEAADILSAEHQQVILPHLDAGCPMADMSTRGAVAAAWTELMEATEVAEEAITPVTYVNSSAAVKSFVGEKGGSSCTSSNAERVLDWALSRGKLVFFFPDQHLGRNASFALGLPEEQVVLWRRGEPLGGCSKEQLQQARVVLWDGYCEVHMRSFPEHVHSWRAQDPQAKIIVHPECRNEVVRLADMSGSTEAIISAVAASQAGSHWVIGTELNLVERLAKQHPDKSIHSLTPSCLCPTMSAVKPANLLWVLDNLAERRVVNQIQVPEEIALQAKSCLDRMLSI